MTPTTLHTAMLASQRFTRWASYQLDRQDREEQVRKAAEELMRALEALEEVRQRCLW